MGIPSCGSPGCQKVGRPDLCVDHRPAPMRPTRLACDTCGRSHRTPQYHSRSGQPITYTPVGPRALLCLGCGRAFRGHGGRKYCTKGCYRESPAFRAAKQRAKAKRRGVVRVGAYDRLAIFARDKWRCGICGGAVPRTAKVPDHMAPTIDHIVALAHGGSDEWSNVRLAHFICNTRRGVGTVGGPIILPAAA